MRISRLYNKSIISLKAYQVCTINQFNTISTLEEYLISNKDFMALTEYDSETNNELVHVVNLTKIMKSSSFKKVRENIKKDIEIEKKLLNLAFATEEQMLEIVNTLTRKDRDAINEFITLLLTVVSTRAKNSFIEYYDNNLKVKSILRKEKLVFRTNNSSVNKIGKKTFEEINYFYEQLYKNIILTCEDSLELKSQYLEVLTSNSKLDNNIVIDFSLIKNSGLQVIDSLIKNNIFFDERTDMILNSINIYSNYNYKTLEELGELYKVSRERVRQIREKYLKEFESQLIGMRSLYIDDIFSIGFFQNDGLIEISENIIFNINSVNSVNFSKDFIVYLYSIAAENQVVIPNINIDLLANKNGYRFNEWSGFYLVSKDVSYKLSFDKMIEDIKNRSKDRIEEDYFLNFEIYLQDFLCDDIKLDQVLIDVCEKLINKECEVFLNLYNEIEFKRNVKMRASDLAYEILKEVGVPTKIDKLYDVLLSKYPEFSMLESSFRNTFGSDNRFVPIGRQSVWGLKEWEYQRDDFLGGSMLEMAEKLLQERDVPMHISEIVSNISKYRDTDEDRLIRNLRMNHQGKFVLLKKQYIGLSHKNYSEEYQILEQTNRSWEESYNNLESFMNENSRLPKSNDYDEESSRLYRWFGIQRKRYLEDKLKVKRKEKIERILINHEGGFFYE